MFFFFLHTFISLKCVYWIDESIKKAEKKIDPVSHKTPKMNKIVGTLHLIFGCTPFGKNKGNQLLPVPINKLLAPFNWNVGALFICKLLQFSYIWRVLSSNSNFKISPQVFNGIQFQTILEPSKCFFHPFLGALEVCLRSLGTQYQTHQNNPKTSLNLYLILLDVLCSFLCWTHSVFGKQLNGVFSLKALPWSHLSTRLFPRGILYRDSSTVHFCNIQSSFFTSLCQQWARILPGTHP